MIVWHRNPDYQARTKPAGAALSVAAAIRLLMVGTFCVAAATGLL